MKKRRLLTQFGKQTIADKLPLVEVVETCRILVENHKGVLSYAQEEITIRVSYGCLRIVGRNMKLAEMHCDQLVIFGQIDSVFLQRR